MRRLAAVVVIAASIWAAPPAAAGGFSCPGAPAGFTASTTGQGVVTDVPGSSNSTKFVQCNYFREGETGTINIGARWDESGPNDDFQTACGLEELTGTDPLSGYVYSQERAAHVSYGLLNTTGVDAAELRAMAVPLLPTAEARAVTCVPQDDGGGGGGGGGDDGTSSASDDGETAAPAGGSDDNSSSKVVPVVAVVGGVVVILVGGVVVKRLGKARK